MSIYHYVTRQQLHRLSQSDTTYFKQRLKTNCLLNTILHKPINRHLLNELLCILDNKAIARRKTEHHHYNSEVTVRVLSTEEMERIW